MVVQFRAVVDVDSACVFTLSCCCSGFENDFELSMSNLLSSNLLVDFSFLFVLVRSQLVLFVFLSLVLSMLAV